jgi:hypothetical protein
MLWLGLAFLAIGVLVSLFKGYVVWDVAHDPYLGGGVPTLDFPLICPLPLAVGTVAVFAAFGLKPPCVLGLLLYLGLAAAFYALYWWFFRHGQVARQTFPVQARVPVDDDKPTDQ